MINNADIELLRSIVLKGDKLYCNICDSGLITFLPFGTVLRPNALCSICKSVERHRMLWHFINANDIISADKEIKLLHVAPESHFHEHFKKMKHINYFPVDKFEKGYIYSEDTKDMDIRNIYYDDNYFDLIICNHVLEHIEEDSVAIRELLRVLKIDSKAILQVPINYNLKITDEDFSVTNPVEREKRYGRHDHVRYYGLDYFERLEESGFHVSQINYISQFGKNDIVKFGFPTYRDDIFLCEKRANS